MPDHVDEKLDPKYAEEFTEEGFWEKAVDVLKAAGAKTIYWAIQLFYAAQNPNCPMKLKAAVYAALGYFILPLDIVPDFVPVVGFSDDIGAITGALAMVHMYIDNNVIQEAKDTMCRLFGDDILEKI